MNICFANLTEKNELEKIMLRHLVKSGIRVKVTGNK
jgi:hypothetical protein